MEEHRTPRTPAPDGAGAAAGADRTAWPRARIEESTMGRRVVFAASAVAAGVLYSSFWWEAALPTGLDPGAAYVSELFARDQPFRPLFASAEAAAGLLAAAAGAVGALAWAAGRDRGRTGPLTAGAAGWAALVLFGLLTAADALVPMDCAVTADPACALAEAEGRLSAAHTVHTVTSSAAVAAGLAAMAALAVALPRRARRPGRLRAVLAVPAAAQLAATGVLLWLIAAGADVGAAQRVQVSVFSVWLIALGVAHGPDD
ncbi:DUF998 domain-containing protein [Nocardiopsis baichengensis]|uniref:DUF998 domain-containing protein n=1 Tax=Nocardiopsis baichengensis TaxID=280240 RepID=UPI00037F4572|nr:DUF998 domain-containing protein [Nocardiopsis baichengensis]